MLLLFIVFLVAASILVLRYILNDICFNVICEFGALLKNIKKSKKLYTKSYFILIQPGLLIFIFLNSCYSQNDEKVNIDIDTITITSSEVEVSTSEFSLDGVYKSSESIYSESELTLYFDSTFKYLSEGCLGINLTEGEWNYKNDKIELNSYERFKDISKHEFIYPKENSDKPEPEFISDTFTLTGENIQIKYNPEIYFDGLVLSVVGDNLIMGKDTSSSIFTKTSLD